MGKRQLVIILAFTLLLGAGLNYAGRNMHRLLGGDKSFYAFLLPDLGDRRLIICGRSYRPYQATALWERQKNSIGAWPDSLQSSLRRAGSFLEAPVNAMLSRARSLALHLMSLITPLLKAPAGPPGLIPVSSRQPGQYPEKI